MGRMNLCHLKTEVGTAYVSMAIVATEWSCQAMLKGNLLTFEASTHGVELLTEGRPTCLPETIEEGSGRRSSVVTKQTCRDWSTPCWEVGAARGLPKSEQSSSMTWVLLMERIHDIHLVHRCTWQKQVAE